MAFRRLRRGSGFRRFSGRSMKRQGSSYELAQLSACRVGLALGLCDCTVPDQFFIPLITARDWTTSLITTGDADDTVLNSGPSHAEKGITVRGINFDMAISMVPQTVGVEDQAVSIVSVRYGVVVMAVSPQGSGGQFDSTLPQSPNGNILTHSTAMKLQTGLVGFGGQFGGFEGAKRYRVLWRGMEVFRSILYADSTNFATVAAGGAVPDNVGRSRRVRLRTGARLGMDQGLFLVVEVVNGFLSSNPVLGLELLGTCAVKRFFRGNRYQD